MTKSCFQQKTEPHNEKTKLNCSAKTFHGANIDIESEIWLKLWKLRQCLSNASEIFFGE